MFIVKTFGNVFSMVNIKLILTAGMRWDANCGLGQSNTLCAPNHTPSLLSEDMLLYNFMLPLHLLIGVDSGFLHDY